MFYSFPFNSESTHLHNYFRQSDVSNLLSIPALQFFSSYVLEKFCCLYFMIILVKLKKKKFSNLLKFPGPLSYFLVFSSWHPGHNIISYVYENWFVFFFLEILFPVTFLFMLE